MENKEDSETKKRSRLTKIIAGAFLTAAAFFASGCEYPAGYRTYEPFYYRRRPVTPSPNYGHYWNRSYSPRIIVPRHRCGPGCGHYRFRR